VTVGTVTVGTVTVTDVTGVVTVADVGGFTGTVVTAGTDGTASTDGTDGTTPLTVSVGEVEIVEIADISPAGWEGSEEAPALSDGRSLVGVLSSAPCRETARDGCRKAEPSTERCRPTTSGCPSTLGAKACA